MKNMQFISGAALIFILGISVGHFATPTAHEEAIAVNKINEKDHSYRFTNPLLGFDLDLDAQRESWQQFQQEITDLIEEKKTSGKIHNASLHLLDLENGQWLEINGEDRYSPASLLKVFIMMGLLKRAELNPAELFSKKLFYDGSLDLNTAEIYRPAISLQAGWYTIDALMRRMIIESGNNSAFLLRNELGFESFQNLYNDLPLPLPENNDFSDFMNPREYSILFRMLYNATYLSPEMSERALTLLSQTTFKKGLVADLPNGIPVAHKFGESAEELHDCGIIYTEQPYFICVMTRGPSFPELESLIQEISRLTYDFQIKEIADDASPSRP